jgi:hypothetical protein
LYRYRSALHDVAERVRNNAHDDIAAAAAAWAAERHALEYAADDERAAHEAEAAAAEATIAHLRDELERERTAGAAGAAAAREAWDGEREKMRRDAGAAAEEASARLVAAIASFEPERVRLKAELARARDEVGTVAAASEARWALVGRYKSNPVDPQLGSAW